MIAIMGLTAPPEMTGRSLIEITPEGARVDADVTEEAEA
jgi:hypothetical protein